MSAKIYAPPEEAGEAPSLSRFMNSDSGFSFLAYNDACQEYTEKVAELARAESPDDPWAGQVFRYPVADGKAHYVVWESEPLTLIHLPLGDAYHMPDVVRRGLELQDIEKYAKFESFWEEQTESEDA